MLAFVPGTRKVCWCQHDQPHPGGGEHQSDTAASAAVGTGSSRVGDDGRSTGSEEHDDGLLPLAFSGAIVAAASGS